MSVFEFKTRISYDDIGEDLSLTMRGAISLMQEAAIIHSDRVGYSVNDVQRTQVIWMLVQWRVQMLGKAYWNEPVTVRTWPRTMERATSERDFELVDGHGRAVAVGESVWVLVNARTGRIVRIPPEVSQAYDLTQRRAIDAPFEIASCDVPGILALTDKVRRRDIDTNDHVNNRVYLDYAFEALPDTVDISSFREVVIRYRDQLVCGQGFCCVHKQLDGADIIEICSEDRHILHAVVILR